MGCMSSKYREENAKLREGIQRLEEEIQEERRKWEQESNTHRKCVALLSAKEVEWMKESQRCTEEIALLKRRFKEEEDGKRRRAVETTAGELQQELGVLYLVEQMRAEHARKEEAAEKWKRLYHTIKAELDDLVLRTHQGEMLFWEHEEVIDGLRQELRTREEAMERMKLRLAAMEEEGIRREREIDILRQSLRILSNPKRTKQSKQQQQQHITTTKS